MASYLFTNPKLCRSTGKVRTGYGSVRQDVNVSVAGGTRVEIKGVPQISRMPRLIYNEARRQCSLLAIREELLRRGITRDSNVCRRADVSRIVAKSRYAPIRTCLADGGRVKCVLLEGFAGLLNAVTQEHTAFAKEFSDRIRVIACLTVLPNMVHSDDASESLYCQDWQRLFKKMEASHRDALILTWGNEEDTETACREIGIRAQEATVGIPSDTRQALKDGTNGFERVLPGAERMYPDTDLPPIAIPAERRERIRAGLPDYFWDREDEYRKLGLPEDVIDALSISPRAELFAQLVKELAVPPTLAGVVLCQQMKALRREGLDVDGLDNGVVLDVFRAHANGGLAREGLLKILRYLLAAANLRDAAKPSVKQALIALCLRPVSDEEVTRRIRRCLLEAEGRHFPTMVQMHRSLMGVLMKDLRGCFEGARLASLLEKSLERTPVLNSTARA